jgi:hypothetical protein
MVTPMSNHIEPEQTHLPTSPVCLHILICCGYELLEAAVYQCNVSRRNDFQFLKARLLQALQELVIYGKFPPWPAPSDSVKALAFEPFHKSIRIVLDTSYPLRFSQALL